MRALLLGGLAAVVSVGIALLVNLLTSNVGLPGWLSNGDRFASVLGLLVSVAGILVASLPWWARRSDGDEPSAEPTVEARIEDATRALEMTAGLVNELQVEMRARMATLERLRAENAEFEKLAAVRREEAEAVSRLIENVIDSTHSKLSRSSRRDQMLFFVAGLAASIPVQLVVSWLS